jgi:hypothetical protein
MCKKKGVADVQLLREAQVGFVHRRNSDKTLCTDGIDRSVFIGPVFESQLFGGHSVISKAVNGPKLNLNVL